MQYYSHKLVTNFIEDFGLRRRELNLPKTAGHTSYVIQAAEDYGLRVEKHGIGYFFYHGEVLVGGMRNMLSSLVSSIATSICANKTVSKSLVEAAGVPVAHGKAFRVSEFEEALAFFHGLNKPVVVKPVDGRAGAGVTGGVENEVQFLRAWEFAAESIHSQKSILVEEFIPGIDVRAFVVGDRMVAAATRVPAYVVGDGLRSISVLIEEKNLIRSRNSYLRRLPLVADHEWLATRGYDLDTIPRADEIVTINSTANLHLGGENVDITDVLHPDIAELSVKAAKAIPGLGVAGIDFLIRTPTCSDGVVFLEANTKANIRVHHCPAFGKPVNVGKAIVEQMLKTAGIDYGTETPEQPESFMRRLFAKARSKN